MVHNVIIIGSGPAGYTAGLYAGRADLSPVIFAGAEVGGQLLTTTEVENFPGFPKGILGPELMIAMRTQCERFGAKVIEQNVTKVDFSSQPLKVYAGDEEYQAKTVIIATGATARRLGLPTERALYGKGVSACATCDGFFFKGKNVVVVGGGDTAMEEANFLTKFASSVTIIHRRDEFRASKAMQTKVLGNPKISVIYDTVVEEILGLDVGHVTGVKLKNVKTNEVVEMQADGVFAAIGHEPNTKIFDSILEKDEKGYLVPIERVRTKIPGVFVAGDVADPRYRQAITAAGSGCMAAIEAEKFIEDQ